MTNTILTVDMITREALRVFTDHNVFLNVPIVAAPRAATEFVLPPVTPNVAVAAAAAAIVAANPKISRRFWDPRTWNAGVHREEAACRTPSPAEPTRRNGEVA